MSRTVTPGQVDASTGELQFTVGKDGTPRINLAIEVMPQFLIEANAAVEDGRIGEAVGLLGDRNIATIRQMADSDTCRTDVMFMLAMMFFRVKDFGNSEIWFKQVLNRQPHALIYHELGRICMFTGRMSEAMEHRRKAVEADPDNAMICQNYATDLIRVGRAQEGVDLLRKAVELAPRDTLTHSRLLWNLSFLPDISPQMLLDEHKEWALIHAPVSVARTSHGNVPDPDRRLRVGYISPDFRKHSVAYNFEAFLDGRDHGAVEVYGYGNIGLPDEVTERLKHKFDHYRHIRGQSDKAVADTIEQDQIDILVEIGGHTPDNRLGVLARKPAPIQVGYGGISTSGMQQIDYRLTDAVLDSAETQRFYVEESVYLPTGLLCYKPPASAPPVGPLAAVQNGYVTFASFNNSCKISDHIMALWADILKAVDDSRLLLKFRGGYDQAVRDHYSTRFERLGIDRERLEMVGWKSSAEHLQLYNQVDIGLDTFPYTGGLTTLEAMWMGVPVITLVGGRTDYFLSRAGLSMLQRVGLESLAASSSAEYISRAVALSQDPEALAEMRASMRQRLATSVLCDADAYARGVEAAYRKMWNRWCKGTSAGTAQYEDADDTDTFNRHAMSLIRTGQVEHTIELLRERLQRDPSNATIRSTYLWAVHYLPDLDPQSLYDEHRQWARIHAPVNLARTSHDNNPDPERRLRVGYISSNFSGSLFANNFHAYLSQSDCRTVETYGYGKVAKPDKFTGIISDSFDHYRDIHGMADEAASAMIEQDKIDILVNTGGGHEVQNGYGIMKYKPAPVQVDYGAINTTGMEQVDYRFTDAILDPPELHRFYVEKPVCLPGGFFNYRAPSDSPPVTPLPAIERGYVTFGSFNSNCKVNPHIMSLWARILREVAGSRFILKFSIAVDRQIEDDYLHRFEQFGIERRRIEVHGIKPHPKHMELYGSADIALDTHPFNGCMTTLQCLWMGVPVISLTGEKSLLSRTGLSILSRVGLEFFAASAPEEYVAKAITLATKLEALAQIRGSMRQRMLAGTLCDHKAYAVGIETAYRQMWRRWCRSQGSAVAGGTT